MTFNLDMGHPVLCFVTLLYVRDNESYQKRLEDEGPDPVASSDDSLGLLGSDVDATFLDEIQGIESLMLVPAHVGTPPSQPTRVSAAPSQSPAGSSRNDWPLMVSIVWFRGTAFVTP